MIGSCCAGGEVVPVQIDYEEKISQVRTLYECRTFLRRLGADRNKNWSIPTPTPTWVGEVRSKGFDCNVIPNTQSVGGR